MVTVEHIKTQLKTFL